MIDSNQVAEMLGLTAQTVKNWARDKILPAYKFGSKWRFNKEEIEEWIEECKN